MPTFTIDLPDKLKEQFDSFSDTFRLSKKEILVIAIMLFLWLSEAGFMAQLQNMALKQNKPINDMILEFLKMKIGGK